VRVIDADTEVPTYLIEAAMDYVPPFTMML
jgi:hypothetical protein